MPRKKKSDFDIYEDNYGEEELETLLELLEDFPELSEYLDDVLTLDDEDFYMPES